MIKKDSAQSKVPPRQVVLGVGAGGCGLLRFAQLLNRQPDCSCSFYAPPTVNWHSRPKAFDLSNRIIRFLNVRPHRVVADVSHAYLPLLRELLESDVSSSVRVVGLYRDPQTMLEGIVRWTDATSALPTDHWRHETDAEWTYHPIWTATFPKIMNAGSRHDAIKRYIEDYETELLDLAERFPTNVCRFDADKAFNATEHEQELLAFCGIAPALQHKTQSFFGEDSVGPIDRIVAPVQPRYRLKTTPGSDPRRCVVLVPSNGTIVPQCEESLRALERRGYEVWRVGGYAAIDQARNQMATDALLKGFEETMWIDSDVSFDPDEIERLRAYGLPITSGIYPMKGRRALASHVIAGTDVLSFGQSGGLCEIRYAATGFLHVRREVYRTIQQELELPVCNEQFERPTIPFFQPMIHHAEAGDWYLAEDFAFCQRARQCRFRIMADTRIRLWHHGSYGYGWEDAGMTRPRFKSFDLDLRAVRNDETKHSP